MFQGAMSVLKPHLCHDLQFSKILTKLFSGRFWTDIFSPCLAWSLTAFRGRDLVRPHG